MAMEPSTHDEIRELSSLYVLGGLTPEERAAHAFYLFGRQQLRILQQRGVEHVADYFSRRGKIRPDSPRPQPVDRAAASHRQQPRAHGAAGDVVARGVTPSLRKHVLDDVFGIGGILQDPDRD